MRFSRTRLAPEQSARRIPPRHGRWPRAPAAGPPRRGPAGEQPRGNPAASSLSCPPGWRPFAPAGSVVHAFSATMASSDSRSALPRFTDSPLIGLVAPSPPPRVALQGSHCWGGDGSLLFPHRLSHRSMPSTPRGSSGLPLQALHPFPGLRLSAPGSAPRCPARAGSFFRRGRLRFMLRTGGLLLPTGGSTPRFNAPISPYAGGLLQRRLGPSFGRTRTG